MFIQTKDKEEGKSGESEPENAAISVQTEEASEMGQRNNDRRRVRNRRFKIKRFMPQPKNTDVRHDGRVVRRIFVRRQTICPTI